MSLKLSFLRKTCRVRHSASIEHKSSLPLKTRPAFQFVGWRFWPQSWRGWCVVGYTQSLSRYMFSNVYKTSGTFRIDLCDDQGHTLYSSRACRDRSRVFMLDQRNQKKGTLAPGHPHPSLEAIWQNMSLPLRAFRAGVCERISMLCTEPFTNVNKIVILAKDVSRAPLRFH